VVKNILLIALLLAMPMRALADPPTLSAVPTVSTSPNLDPANARIFIIRESSFDEMLANARLYIGDTKIGAISNGSAVVFDYAAGTVELRFDNPLTLFGGDLKFPMQLAAGQTYYLLIGGTIGRLGSVGAVDLAERRKTNVCSTDWCAREITSDDAKPLLQAYPPEKIGK
jgi:hypothetical protein